jgi:hypothetical protein
MEMSLEEFRELCKNTHQDKNRLVKPAAGPLQSGPPPQNHDNRLIPWLVIYHERPVVVVWHEADKDWYISETMWTLDEEGMTNHAPINYLSYYHKTTTNKHAPINLPEDYHI